MAKNDNLNDFLLDLADIIRTKTGTTDLINPQDFSTKISEIRSVIEKPVQYVVVPSGHTLISNLITLSTYIKIITENGVIIGPPVQVADMLQEVSYNYLAFEIDFNRKIVEDRVESLLNIDLTNTTIISKYVFDSIGTSIKIPLVDLGLPSGTLWASQNLGATKPEEVGRYYHWGNSYGVPYTSFYWNNRPFYNTTDKKYTKYTPDDGLGVLEPADDAVNVYDSTCQFPSPEDYQELFDNTTISNENINGVKGLKFTSTINGQSIFFPNSGYAWHYNNPDSGYNSYLWTNTCNLNSAGGQSAYGACLDIKNLSASLISDGKERGCCIRPIQRIKTE